MTSLSTKLPRPHSGIIRLKPATSPSLTRHLLGVLERHSAAHLHAPAVMLNVPGQHVEAAETYVTEIPAHFHYMVN